MEPQLSHFSRRGRWTAAAMVTWLSISTFSSQVQSQSVAIVQWSPHTPAVIGQSLTLACVFNSPVRCTWSRGDHEGPNEVRSGGGYSYDGDYKTVTTQATTDCSLTIAAVKREDFAIWYCSSPQINKPKYFPWTYITEQVTPSPPIIWLNSVKVSEIELPSPDQLSQMVCSSNRGNPPPSLHWEVNGTIYSGKLQTTPADSHLYTVHLHWDPGSEWKTLANVSEIICKANHPGFTNTKVTKVELRRKYAPRTVTILADGFNVDNITIGHGASVLLSCISDGHPQPTTYKWELWSDDGSRWKSYRHNMQNITVTIRQLGTFRCKVNNGLNRHSPTTSINQLTVIESMPPSAPVIMFNNEIVSVIELPSPDPPSHMVCRSSKGNPPPQLQWEVNGTRYLGRTGTIDVGDYLYINELRWDRGGGWHTFDNVNEVVCIAKYNGLTNAIEESVEINRNYTDGNMVNESDTLGFNGIVAIVLSATLIITIIISTTCVIHLRRKLSRRNEVPPSPLMPTLAQLSFRSNATTDSQVTDPVSVGATSIHRSPSVETVLYDDARSYARRCSSKWTDGDVDASDYLIPLPVYEEVQRNQPPQVEGQDDNGYDSLL